MWKGKSHFQFFSLFEEDNFEQTQHLSNDPSDSDTTLVKTKSWQAQIHGAKFPFFFMIQPNIKSTLAFEVKT